jgi:hypothetical protein
LSTKTILGDIIDNIENNKNKVQSVLSLLIPSTDLLIFCWKQSIIDYKEYYKICARISMETSNTQTDCDNMEFWVFNNYMTFITEILDEKNKKSGDGTNQTSPDQTVQKTLNQSKNFLNSGKSKFKSP